MPPPPAGPAGAATAAEALAAAKKDADAKFSGTDAGAPAEKCPLAKGPTLVSNGADAVTKSTAYKGCPEDVKDKIASKEFSESEKKGIEDVLDKYKPLFECDNVPVKKIGRSDKGITKSTAGCVAETTTMGEWFEDSGTLVLMDAASSPEDFPDADSQFKGTVAHELAHGLLNNFDPRTCKAYKKAGDNPVMKEFRKAAGWDATGTTLTETDKDKAATSYSKTNSQEDLSEAMMLYLYDQKKLKDASPARYEFCKKLLGYK